MNKANVPPFTSFDFFSSCSKLFETLVEKVSKLCYGWSCLYLETSFVFHFLVKDRCQPHSFFCNFLGLSHCLNVHLSKSWNYLIFSSKADVYGNFTRMRYQFNFTCPRSTCLQRVIFTLTGHRFLVIIELHTFLCLS